MKRRKWWVTDIFPHQERELIVNTFLECWQKSREPMYAAPLGRLSKDMAHYICGFVKADFTKACTTGLYSAEKECTFYLTWETQYDPPIVLWKSIHDQYAFGYSVIGACATCLSCSFPSFPEEWRCDCKTGGCVSKSWWVELRKKFIIPEKPWEKNEEI